MSEEHSGWYAQKLVRQADTTVSEKELWCYISTKRLPDLNEGAPMVTDTVLATTSAHLMRKVAIAANKAKGHTNTKR